jgi:hypothetical protein
MRLYVCVGCCVLLGTSVKAEEKEPFAARTTTFIIPAVHNHTRTGTDRIPQYAAPGKSSSETGGYIGGGKLIAGEGRGVTDGVFGWDYVGLGRRPGRVFLNWFNDSPKQSAFLPKYNTEGPRVTDIVALQPFKKAVREARTEHQEKKSGEKSGGHGE